MIGLLVNGLNKTKSPKFAKFLFNQSIFDSTLFLEDNSDPNPNGIDIQHINLYQANFSDKEKVNIVVKDLFQTFQVNSVLFFIENNISGYEEDFMNINILEFKEKFLEELLKRIYPLQVIIEKLRENQRPTQLIFILPEKAQTKLIDDKIGESMFFTTMSMIITAIADEFVENEIYCNAVIENDRMLETLEWLLFEATEKEHGKLFSGKKVILW